MHLGNPPLLRRIPDQVPSLLRIGLQIIKLRQITVEVHSVFIRLRTHDRSSSNHILPSHFRPVAHQNLTIHLGLGIFQIFGGAYEPLLHGTVTLFVMWLLLLWMYRWKLFVKI